jgi:signal transduction histidine kinase
LWIQLLIIIVLSVLFWQGGNRGSGVFDFQGLMAGLEMSLRALLVISGFTGISSELRNPLVRAFLFRRGLRQVYGSVSLAFQALPSMLEEAVRPRELIRRPFTAVAKMLASAGKWEKAFEEAGIDEIKDAD